jgi:hypothetical protein
MSEIVTVLCGYCGESIEIPSGEEQICLTCAEKRQVIRKSIEDQQNGVV